MVVLSPPGIISEPTLRNCSGFLISTPFTPSLRSAGRTNKRRDSSGHELHFQNKTANARVRSRRRTRKREEKTRACDVLVERSLESEDADRHLRKLFFRRRRRWPREEAGREKERSCELCANGRERERDVEGWNGGGLSFRTAAPSVGFRPF